MNLTLTASGQLHEKLYLCGDNPLLVSLNVVPTNKTEYLLSVGKQLESEHLSISEKFVNVYRGSDEYTGPYTVTPDIKSQKLETKDKHLSDDVNVKEIPTYEVSNNTGTTFYIGKEVI